MIFVSPYSLALRTKFLPPNSQVTSEREDHINSTTAATLLSDGLKKSSPGGNRAASLSYDMLSLKLLPCCCWETSLEDRQTNDCFANLS